MAALSGVFYCDGGFLLPTSQGGTGVHGYTYEETTDKPRNIKILWNATKSGYMDKKSAVDPVKVIDYIDIIGPMDRARSSSETECAAIIQLLEYLDASEQTYEKIYVYSDSKNVVTGINSWRKKWRQSNWISSTGTPVKFVERWKRLDELLERLMLKTKVTVEWIKGHAGDLGNETADQLATRGLILTKNGNPDTVITHTPEAAYWSAPKEHNPPDLLRGPRMYMSTYRRNRYAEKESEVYFIGTHGGKEREPDEQGKPYPCNYLSVIRMSEGDPVIGAVRDRVLDIEEERSRVHGTLVTLNTQNLLSKRIYSEILTSDTSYLSVRYKPIVLSTHDDLIIAEEVVPVGRAFRLVEICSVLHSRLKQFTEGEGRFIEVDILDQFYDTVKKKDGTEHYKIKSTLGSGVKVVDITGTFSTNKDDTARDRFTRRIRLILGSDCPTRNHLSSLDSTIEKMSFVSWRDSATTCRYGIYIRLKNGDDGLWTRYDANLILANIKR